MLTSKTTVITVEPRDNVVIRITTGATVEVQHADGDASTFVQTRWPVMDEDEVEKFAEGLCFSANEGCFIWHVPEEEKVYTSRDGGIAIEILG